METILIQAQTLVYTLLGLMPTSYQRDSLQAMLGLFLGEHQKKDNPMIIAVWQRFPQTIF
jgi:hypothetical protein